MTESTLSLDATKALAGQLFNRTWQLIEAQVAALKF